MIGQDWIEILHHPHEIRKPGGKRSKRRVTWYRQEKSAAHTTIGGRGIVARLMRRRARRG